MRNIYRYSFILAFVFASGAFAQESEPSDEGAGFNYEKYRGVRAVIEGTKYLLEPRLSGQMKNFHDIDQASHRSFAQLSHRAAAFKGQAALPAWNRVGGHQGEPTAAINSGRTRDIAFGPGNVAYVATSNGGLWKTEDFTGGGTNTPVWIPLTDRLPTLSLGSVAVDPTNPNIVYLGTGEKAPDGADPSTIIGLGNGMGDGLYKSVDGGLNWTRLCDARLTGERIAEVLIDPRNPQTIYVACNQARSTSGSDTSGGVLKSTDGGNSWRASNLKGFQVYYMAMDINDPKRLYVSGVGNIFRTSDGGDSWEQIKVGITGTGRIAIDVCPIPENSNILYASVGNPGSGTNGVYISTDYGSTWKKNKTITDVENYLWIQPWFANAIAAHPTNHKIAMAGGLHVAMWSDSGKGYKKAGDANAINTSQVYSHADVHNIIYKDAANLFVNHDGGLSYSKNNGNAWIKTINNGLATMLFVGVDADQDFTFVLGGTQDNGTNKAMIGELTFKEVWGGDGGRTWVSPQNSNICYTTRYEEQFFQSLNKGETWTARTVSSPCPFYPRYDADASGEVIALGASSKIVVSKNGGVDGFAQKSTQNISNARAVRVFPSNAELMWAGSGSGLWRSNDGGVNFTRTAIANAGTITDIDVDPSNPMNLWICTQGYGSNVANVFQSTDGGVTVTPIPNFPDSLGCNAIARQHSTGRIFVGTDRGVVFTEDNGQNWYTLPDGMPNVPVNSMKIKGTDNDKLLAGTYGRGMFWLDLKDLPVISVDGEAKKPDAPIAFISTYPNPVRGNKATIAFEMKEAGIMTAALLDVLGREVKVLEKAQYPAGASQFDFTTDGVTSGTYIVLLTANGTTVSERIVVN